MSYHGLGATAADCDTMWKTCVDHCFAQADAGSPFLWWGTYNSCRDAFCVPPYNTCLQIVGGQWGTDEARKAAIQQKQAEAPPGPPPAEAPEPTEPPVATADQKPSPWPILAGVAIVATGVYLLAVKK